MNNPSKFADLALMFSVLGMVFCSVLGLTLIGAYTLDRIVLWIRKKRS